MSDSFLYTSVRDPLAKPLFDGLEQEYSRRYQDVYQRLCSHPRAELERYPPEMYTPPHGNFLLLLRHGKAISGGAFMRHTDPGTAEFKRIWTRGDLRRQGLARRVLAELEAQAARQGYTRVYLTTGSQQSEAAGLYLSHGYVALPEIVDTTTAIRQLPFEKALRAPVTTFATDRADACLL